MTEERKSENALRKPRVDVVIPTYKEDHCNEYRKGILE